MIKTKVWLYLNIWILNLSVSFYLLFEFILITVGILIIQTINTSFILIKIIFIQLFYSINILIILILFWSLPAISLLFLLLIRIERREKFLTVLLVLFVECDVCQRSEMMITSVVWWQSEWAGRGLVLLLG